MRATVVNLRDKYIVVSGEPILDTDEGVLIIAFSDGTSRTFNWDHVRDYYYMTDEEFDQYFGESEEE